jgi:hypothetical protein
MARLEQLHCAVQVRVEPGRIGGASRLELARLLEALPERGHALAPHARFEGRSRGHGSPSPVGFDLPEIGESADEALVDEVLRPLLLERRPHPIRSDHLVEIGLEGRRPLARIHVPGRIHARRAHAPVAHVVDDRGDRVRHQDVEIGLDRGIVRGLLLVAQLLDRARW